MRRRKEWMRSTFKVTKIEPAALKIRMRTRRTETIPPSRETVLFCFVLFFVFSIFDLFLFLIFYLFVFFFPTPFMMWSRYFSRHPVAQQSFLHWMLPFRSYYYPTWSEEIRCPLQTNAHVAPDLIFRHREIRFVFDSARISLFLYFRSKKVKQSKANSRPTRGRSWT